MFEMPDEVIFELMDERYDGEDVYDPYNWYTPARMSNKRAKCKLCGYTELKWVDTKFGKRLEYTSGYLKGKIHICQK